MNWQNNNYGYYLLFIYLPLIPPEMIGNVKQATPRPIASSITHFTIAASVTVL